MRILLLGGTGTTGSFLVEQLGSSDAQVRVGSRNPSSDQGAVEHVQMDLGDRSTWDQALEGVDRAYLLLPAIPEAPELMNEFIDQGKALGLERVVLLSSSAIKAGGPGIGVVHEHLVKGVNELDYAVLRPSWFMQNFLGSHFQARSISEEGVLFSATGTARIGFIDAFDIAAVAAALLIAEEPLNRDLILTGPQAISYDQVAEQLSRVSGRVISHRDLGIEGLGARLSDLGLPLPLVSLLVGLDEQIARGAEDRVTGEVEAFTGRPARGFEDFVLEHAKEWQLS